jgi:ABC-type Fe3+-siderophore transport system permease subunit
MRGCFTVFLSMRHGKIPVMTLLLAGVAVSMLLGAIPSGLLTFMNDRNSAVFILDGRWLGFTPLGHMFI